MECIQQCPVFVLIRYPLDLGQAVKNSLIRTLPVHKNYDGQVSGISRSVEVMEGQWPCNKGMVILCFGSLREAELWKNSVPEIRQPDWMGGCDMLIVPVRKMPPVNKRFVQVLEIRFADYKKYVGEYAHQAEEYLECGGAHGGVVTACHENIHKVKGLWNPCYLVLNFWPSCQCFDAAVKTEKYQEIRQVRFDSAYTSSCVFHLDYLCDRLPCIPPPCMNRL